MSGVARCAPRSRGGSQQIYEDLLAANPAPFCQLGSPSLVLPGDDQMPGQFESHRSLPSCLSSHPGFPALRGQIRGNTQQISLLNPLIRPVLLALLPPEIFGGRLTNQSTLGPYGHLP